MSRTRKYTAIVTVAATKKDGSKEFVIRKSDGTSGRVVTSASTAVAIKHAVNGYAQALKELADE